MSHSFEEAMSRVMAAYNSGNFEAAAFWTRCLPHFWRKLIEGICLCRLKDMSGGDASLWLAVGYASSRQQRNLVRLVILYFFRDFYGSQKDFIDSLKV